jgi:hypothetical protein
MNCVLIMCCCAACAVGYFAGTALGSWFYDKYGS